eukprot:757924-Hanusia_phi.AAC.2
MSPPLFYSTPQLFLLSLDPAPCPIQALSSSPCTSHHALVTAQEALNLQSSRGQQIASTSKTCSSQLSASPADQEDFEFRRHPRLSATPSASRALRPPGCNERIRRPVVPSPSLAAAPASSVPLFFFSSAPRVFCSLVLPFSQSAASWRSSAKGRLLGLCSLLAEGQSFSQLRPPLERS